MATLTIGSAILSATPWGQQMAKLTFSETVNLIFQKDTQIQTLWAVYTVVQFAAGSFGIDHYYNDHKMPALLGGAVLLGVWAFNLGHLGMILRCISQIEILKKEVAKNPDVAQSDDSSLLKVLFPEKTFSFKAPIGFPSIFGRGYVIAILIHLFIDLCATAGLLSRVKF